MTDKRPLKKGDHLYLVDGSGYLFRAYHALPPLSRKSDGLPTGAVSGFCNMLWKLLEDTKSGDKPTHLAVIFDAGKKTFRNEIYPQYKANRPEPPEDLIPQFPLVREATRAFGVPAIEMPGFEADDLIATYARLAREAGAKVTIMSSDKDLMQLVVDGQGRTARSDEEQAPGLGRGDGEIRRAAVEGRRSAGAGGRLDGQCARRARHRREDGGRTHQCLRRSGNAAEARGRNQAAEAPRDIGRERGECAHLAQARDAR